MLALWTGEGLKASIGAGGGGGGITTAVARGHSPDPSVSSAGEESFCGGEGTLGGEGCLGESCLGVKKGFAAKSNGSERKLGTEALWFNPDPRCGGIEERKLVSDGN